MTTVAYRDGILAGDTRTVAGNTDIVPGRIRKVHRLRNGSLIGFAGTVGEIQEIMRRVKKAGDGILTIKPKGPLEGLLVYPDGQVMQLDKDGWIHLKAPYYAIGTGALAALVAMRLGKSAVDAVRLAGEFDASTGGRIQTVRLEK